MDLFITQQSTDVHDHRLILDKRQTLFAITFCNHDQEISDDDCQSVIKML